MRAGVSLALRGVCAIVLMIMFYVMAVVVFAGLVALGIVVIRAVPSVRNVRLIVVMGAAALACFVAAAVVIWSVLPRIDRFTPPGPEVKAADHPRLFAELRAVAAATGERMPAHVYLMCDVNAFVAQRGGLMGIGSRRVMGLGLPLLRTLQVDELRAVLAHEMGHFYGGDTRVGPWIYKTRGGLARTVVNLARVGQATDHWITFVFTAVQAPFRWFLMGFLRVSQAISRAQEYSADAVAVRAEGQRAVIGGLKKVHAAAIAHSLYLQSEVLPLLRRGALPAVGDGFSRFLATEVYAELLERASAHDASADASVANPYDSHPPLAARIAAAQAVAGGPDRPADPRRAIELVDGADRIETDELARHAGGKLEHISWDATDQLWITAWRKDVRSSRPLLAELRVDEMSSDLAQVYRLAGHLLGEKSANAAAAHDFAGWWLATAGAALAVLLVDAGFTLTAHVGAPFRFGRDDLVVEPFSELRQLLTKQTSQDAWRARWTERGFAGTRLAAPLASGAPRGS